MKQVTSLREDKSAKPIKTSTARSCAAMSLICIVLSSCSSPQRQVVDEIVTSWREHRSLPNIDETLTINSAYQVQTRSVRAKLDGDTPAGFKAGLTSAPSQARFKTNEAVAGVLFKEGARKSADTLRLSELRGLHIEVELAMRISTTIDRPLDDVAALRTHIDGIAPAIELPNLDYSQPLQALNAIDVIATNVSAANYIVGEFVSPQQRDPNTVAIRLDCNDKEMFSGPGARLARRPVASSAVAGEQNGRRRVENTARPDLAHRRPRPRDAGHAGTLRRQLSCRQWPVGRSGNQRDGMTMNALYAAHLAIHRRRTDEAMAATGFDALAIYAGALRMQFLDDQPYPFKANPHFRLWTPLVEAADCWIVYRPSQPLQLVFLQPLDYWYKPPEMPSDFWTAHFQIDVIREASQAKAHVAGLPRCAFIGEWQDEFADWGFADRNPSDLLHRLHYARAAKTDYELECMRRASQIAARAHRAAEAEFRKGGSEYEIHMAYVRASGQTENELPYPNIVALNSNAAVLHYQNQERIAPAKSRSFLIDAGGQFNGYASDVTRTYSREQDDFASMIVAMNQLQLELCSQVRARRRLRVDSSRRAIAASAKCCVTSM